MWDLDDIVSMSDLAAEFGTSRATPANWPARFPDFPKPLTSVACGQTYLYSLAQVRAWHDSKDWAPWSKHFSRLDK